MWCVCVNCFFAHSYIAFDYDAVAIIHDVQGYSELPEDAVASVLKAGNVCIIFLFH